MNPKGLKYPPGLVNAIPGATVFIIYFLFCFLFQEARWLYTDSAYLVFRILNHEALFFDRWANLIQVLPAQIAAYFNAPSIIILSLLNFTLPFLYFITWIYFHRKNNLKALLLPLLLASGGTEMFFLGFSEIHIAALCFGILLQASSFELSVKHFLFIGFWTMIMLLAHPASWLFVPFALFHYTENTSQRRSSLVVIGSCIVYLMLKQIFRPDSNPYDAGLFANLTDISNWKNITSLYSFHYFQSILFKWFFISICGGSLFIIMRFFQKKNIYFSLLYMGYTLTVLAITLVIYSKGESTILMEKFFYPLSILLTIPLVILFKKQNYFLLVYFLVVAGVFFTGTYKSRHFYQNRNKELAKLVQKYQVHGNTKVLIDANQTTPEAFGSAWALPYETMLYTNLHHKKTITIKSIDMKELGSPRYQAADSLYHGADFLPPMPIKTLNKHYFNLPDSPYIVDSSGAMKRN